MSLPVSSFQVGRYQVATAVYEGPLDLLLQLIERAELDITRLALAQVTDQYLAHLHQIQDNSADEVSAFLVIAAKLVQIKSEALLPRPPVREPGEEDPGEALAMQLRAYKRYREIANQLAGREEQHLRTYLRMAAPPHVEGSIDLTGIGLPDLVSAAESIFNKAGLRLPLSALVSAPRITIREKISLISRTLHELKTTHFSFLLKKGSRSRLDIIVTFLAILELVKRHFIEARQDKLFGDIELEPSATWREDEEYELEFGE